MDSVKKRHAAQGRWLVAESNDGKGDVELGEIKCATSEFRPDHDQAGIDILYDGFDPVSQGCAAEPGFLHVPGQRMADLLILYVSIGEPGNAAHHPDRDSRPFAYSSFAGKHDGVHTVENGIGDIRDFGTGRGGGLNHALQHLRGYNYRCSMIMAGADNLFLQYGYFR